MNYNEFINTYNGKSFDYDGTAGIQCVDLIKMYLDKVFGFKSGAWGNAKEYYENFNNLPIKNSFTRIANTPTFIPQKGDIVIYGAGLGNTYGHIAIATGEGDTHQFYSYDLNWGSKIVHKVLHNYKGVLGVLRPNDQSKIISTGKFNIGTTYTTQVILKVRDGVGTKANQVPYANLTANAKEHAISEGINKGCLKVGTKVTCQAIQNDGNDIWIKIPSGWIAGYYSGKDYIK